MWDIENGACVQEMRNYPHYPFLIFSIILLLELIESTYFDMLMYLSLINFWTVRITSAFPQLSYFQDGMVN